MQRIKEFIAILALVFSTIYAVSPVYAGTCATGVSEAECNKICGGNYDAELKAAAGCSTQTKDQLPGHVVNIINAAIAVVGIIAVLVIVIAGQRFLTSAGDPGKIKQAKDMVLYAGIALLVAGLAFAIVAFISNNIISDANLGI